MNSLNVWFLLASEFFSNSKVPTVMFAEKIFPPSDKRDEASFLQAIEKLLKGYDSNPMMQTLENYQRRVNH